jgi:deazaflavin-dependent oxidoreductase (nitroreductase family)
MPTRLPGDQPPLGRARAPGLSRRVLRPLARRLNPVISTRAGRPGVTLFGVVHHRGRRSGREYATPLATRPIPDGFLVPLTFGTRADWCQNVLAAGACVIRWNGATYFVVAPEVVDDSAISQEVKTAFGLLERVFLRLTGVRHFLRLRLRLRLREADAAPRALADNQMACVSGASRPYTH